MRTARPELSEQDLRIMYRQMQLQAAKILVAKARDYAQVIDAWTQQQWENATGWSRTLRPTVPTTAKALKEKNDEDTEGWCERCDSEEFACECRPQEVTA